MFIIKRKKYGWFLTVDGDNEFALTFRRARDVISNKLLQRIQTYLRDRGVEASTEEILDSFESQFVDKVLLRRRPVLVQADVDFVKLPLFYSTKSGLAFALTYTAYNEDDEITYRGKVLVSDGGNVTDYDLAELVKGTVINGYFVKVISPYFEPGDESIDTIEYDEKTSQKILELLSLSSESIVRYEDVMRWLNEISLSGVDALEWLRAVINAIAETVRKYVWSNIKYRDIIALLPVLGIIAPVVDYIIRVIFSSNLPGSGKSYHISLISAFIPYTFFLEEATPASVSRLLSVALNIAIDEPKINEDLVRTLIASFRKDAVRVIVDTSKSSIMSIPLSGIIQIPELGNALDEYSISSALRTRSLVIYVTRDRRIVYVKDPYKDIKEREVVKFTINNKEYSLRVRELYPLLVALFLLTARRLRELYDEINNELSALAREGKLTFDGRTAQAYSPLLVIARVLSEPYFSSVWKFLENMGSGLTLPALDLLKEVGEYVLTKPGDYDDYGYVFRDGDYPIILMRPLGLIRAALIMKYGEVPQYVIRERVEEGENAVLRDIERWIRTNLPEEFSSPRKLGEFLRRTPILSDLFIDAKEKDSARVVGHLIITREFSKIIDYLQVGETSEAERLVQEVRSRVCTELKELINEGKVLLNCSELERGSFSGENREVLTSSTHESTGDSTVTKATSEGESPSVLPTVLLVPPTVLP